MLSLVQDENARLKAGYRKLIMATMFLTFFVMLGMAAIAESLIITLIGVKWLPSVEYPSAPVPCGGIVSTACPQYEYPEHKGEVRPVA